MTQSDKEQLILLQGLIARLDGENAAKLKQNAVLIGELDRLAAQNNSLRQQSTTSNSLTKELDALAGQLLRANVELQVSRCETMVMREHQLCYEEEVVQLRDLLEQKAHQCNMLEQQLIQKRKHEQQMQIQIQLQAKQPALRESQSSIQSVRSKSRRSSVEDSQRFLDSEREIRTLNEQLGEIKGELIEKLSEVETLEKSKEEMQESLQKQMSVLSQEKQKLEKELTVLKQATLSSLLSQLQVSQDEAEKYKGQLAKLQDQAISDLKISQEIQNEVMMTQVSALKSMIQTLTLQAGEDHDQLVKHLQVKTKQLEEVRSWSEEVAMERDQLRKQIFNLKSQYSEMQQKLNQAGQTTANTNQLELQELKKTLQQSKRDSEQRLAEVKNELQIASKTNKQIDALKEQLKEATRLNKQLEDKYQELEFGYDKSNNQLVKLKEQNENLINQLSDLKIAYQKLRAEEVQNNLTKKSLQQDQTQLSQKKILQKSQSLRVNTDNIVSGASTYLRDIETLSFNLSSLIAVNLTLSNELSEVRKQKQKLEEIIDNKSRHSQFNDVIIEQRTQKFTDNEDSNAGSEGKLVKNLLNKIAIVEAQNTQMNERVSELTLMNGYLLRKTTTLELGKKPSSDNYLSSGQTERYQTANKKHRPTEVGQTFMGFMTSRDKFKASDKQKWVNLQYRINSLKLQNDSLKKSLGGKQD